jgi:CDP-diacylglycerol--inositol 3-phosphatidyltransferase
MATKKHKYPNGINPIFLYIPNQIGYARIVLGLLSLLFMPTNATTTMFLYGISCLLDAADGYAARHYNQSSQFGAVLDMVTDRSTTACLLVHLATMYPKYAFLFQVLVALDLSSHYMHMVSSHKSGKESHKAVDEDTPYLMKLYYTDRIVLFLVCAGNEAFFMVLYSLGWWSHWSIYLAFIVTLPVCLFKQFMNGIQLLAASRSLADRDYLDSLKNKEN